MNPMFASIAGSLIRHGLTALSGYLGLQGENVEAISVFLLGVVWAVLEKVRRGR